jgi:hypothetical protein
LITFLSPDIATSLNIHLLLILLLYPHYKHSLPHSSSAGSHKSTVSLTKHFLFTVLPKTFWLYMYYVLVLCALEYIEQAEIEQFQTFV